jgi:1,2-diacylglycerol 3-beta-galactosyltransferase
MNQDARRLVFLLSDTGGGHRSSASAVAQALQDQYDDQIEVEMVDVFKTYAPWPFNRASDIYPHLVKLNGWLWAAGYHLLDSPRRIELFTRVFWPWVGPCLRQLVRDYPDDVFVSFHPAFNHGALRAMDDTKIKPPLITLVTDLATAHAFWIAPDVDCCLIPTDEVRQRALAYGVPEDRLVETGLPVSPRVVRTAQEDQAAVRRRLGLETDLPVVLIVSGADGMGPVGRLCRAVAHSGLEARLVIIAGRNKQLRAKLSAESWPLPVRVEGFVRNMPKWMRAADLLVTKAGPSTISEALVMGLPMVLSGALPGQERPNVDYVVQGGAGIWAPTPSRVAAAVKDLMRPGNPKLAKMAARARALARPDAAQRISEILWCTACEGQVH